MKHTYKEWIKKVQSLDDSCFPKEFRRLKSKKEMTLIEALVLWYFCECDCPHLKQYDAPSLLVWQSQLRKTINSKPVRKMYKKLLPKVVTAINSGKGKNHPTVEAFVSSLILLMDESFLKQLTNQFINVMSEKLKESGVEDVIDRSSMGGEIQTKNN